MRLVPRVTLTLAIATAVMVAVMVALAIAVIWPSFDRLDQKDAARSAEQVYEAVRREQASVARSVRDWAVFDDAYTYAGGEPSTFVEANLFHGPLSNIGIQAAAVYDAQGQQMFALALGADESQPQPSTYLPTQLPPGHVLRAAHPDHNPYGLMQDAMGQLLIAASSAILRSDGGGPVRGTLVMFRRVTPELLASLQQQTRVDFHLHTPQEVEARHVAALTSTGPYVYREDRVTNYSFVPLRDLSGRTAVVIEAHSDRTVAALGRRTLWLMAGVLLAVMMALLLVFGAAINRMVLRPVRDLTRNVLRARRRGRFDAPIKHTGRGDEIDVLARAFGRLYDSQMSKQRALDHARRHAEAATEAKGRFLAMMSHEIRTPMNGVLAMAYNLRTTRLGKRQALMVDTILSSGEALLGILNDVLDVSKIEAGKLSIDRQPFEAARVLADVLDLFAPIARAKGLDLVNEIALPPQQGYCGDALRLRQIAQNLISNAVKFTEKGTVRLSAHEDRSSDGQMWLVLSVSDSGLGIAPEQQTHLFERFEQTDSSITRRFGGTGLGLALVKEITTLMGGDVAVDSVLGVGTTFSVRLPTRHADVAPVSVDDVSAARAEDQPVRILAVDDNATNRLVLKMILENMDAELTFAEDGAVAVEAATARPFDVILMDVHMPVMDGLEATRRIRASSAINARTPILALTADAFPEQIAACLAAGMNSHVAKPIRPDVLFAALAVALTPVDGQSAQGAA